MFCNVSCIYRRNKISRQTDFRLHASFVLYACQLRPVRTFRRTLYETYEHDILKTNEQILLQIGTVGPRGKGMKRGQLRGSGGQRSEEETEVRSGGLADACLQHARMLDPFARVAFLVLLKTTSCL